MDQTWLRLDKATTNLLAATSNLVKVTHEINACQAEMSSQREKVRRAQREQEWLESEHQANKHQCDELQQQQTPPCAGRWRRPAQTPTSIRRSMPSRAECRGLPICTFAVMPRYTMASCRVITMRMSGSSSFRLSSSFSSRANSSAFFPPVPVASRICSCLCREIHCLLCGGACVRVRWYV
jgi:hypothetical protein